MCEVVHFELCVDHGQPSHLHHNQGHQSPHLALEKWVKCEKWGGMGGATTASTNAHPIHIPASSTSTPAHFLSTYIASQPNANPMPMVANVANVYNAGTTLRNQMSVPTLSEHPLSCHHATHHTFPFLVYGSAHPCPAEPDAASRLAVEETEDSERISGHQHQQGSRLACLYPWAHTRYSVQSQTMDPSAV